MARTDTKKVLIAGGGVAALEAALALRALAGDRVDVELLAPESQFWYRPVSVAAPFELGETQHFELDSLARAIGAELTPAGLVGIDAWRRIAHTTKNTQIEYDQLLVACGTVPIPAIPGAITFRGPADTDKIGALAAELVEGKARSVVFAVPWGAVWPLPVYELAILTATHVRKHGGPHVELTVVTPEDEPLQVFGPPANAALKELLADRGIALRTGTLPVEHAEGELTIVGETPIHADRVVALPRLYGPPLDGIPQTVDGFVPVDAHCRVHGLDDVYAAGDVTSFTVKHGGLATQQADAAAAAIAEAAGAPVTAERFRPVLRGLLLTGRQPQYLRRELAFEPELEPAATSEALWWPPAKIVGRYLAPFLASLTGTEAPSETGPAPEAVAVERELDAEALADRERERLLLLADDEGPGVRELVSGEPLLVRPEDTLAEVSERMLAAGASVAAAVGHGRLIGIVTTSDVLRAAAARAHPSDARVRHWMTAEPVTVPVEASALSARTIMEQYGVRHLPVVEGGRPVGIVHLDDVRQLVTTSAGLGF